VGVFKDIGKLMGHGIANTNPGTVTDRIAYSRASMEQGPIVMAAAQEQVLTQGAMTAPVTQATITAVNPTGAVMQPNGEPVWVLELLVTIEGGQVPAKRMEIVPLHQQGRCVVGGELTVRAKPGPPGQQPLVWIDWALLA
jgi:hypothetical protein